MKIPEIAPSILAADFGELRGSVEMINRSQADWIHVDIMDGIFVPNISFGTPVLEAIGRHALKPLDVHLMIVDPDRYIPKYVELGSALITVHYEACAHLHRSLELIHSLGVKAGVALNPHTPVALLEPIIESIDLVCLMSVNPGFGGQKFIPNTLNKTDKLKNLIQRTGASTKIEIDGGVTDKNAKQLVQAGADILVAGSYVFASEDPEGAIRGLKLL